MSVLKTRLGILVHGMDLHETLDYDGNELLIIGFNSDIRQIFAWLDEQVSYERRRIEFELYDWEGKDFQFGKMLALKWISLLVELVEGKSVNIEEEITEYAKNESGIDISPEVVYELQVLNSEEKGLFYRMGFDGRIDTWQSLPYDIAKKRLKNEYKRISKITPRSLVGRWVSEDVDEKVTLVPTSSMDFEKHVLILRAYVVLSEMGRNQVHYKKVMAATRLARTQISGANAFFVGLGFLGNVGKGSYIPTPEVVEFFDETLGQENYGALKPVLLKSILYEKVRNLILIHGKATQDELVDYLLEESGETTRSRAIRALEWLEKGSLIKIDVDKMVNLLE